MFFDSDNDVADQENLVITIFPPVNSQLELQVI
jgi:hypothetical protein